MPINNNIISILVLLLALAIPVMTPQLGSYDPPAPSPSSPPADTPSPAAAPFAENVKSEEREKSHSGGIVAGVVAALCVIVLGHLVGVLHNNNPIIQLNPQGNMPDNPPEILLALINIRHLNSCYGLRCSWGVNPVTSRMWAVIWHPINAAVVPVEIEFTPYQGYTHTVVGFWGQNGHLYLVRISVEEDFDGRPIRWRVDVYSLSTRLWSNVYEGAPFESCKMESAKVCENGVIYFRAFDGPLKDRTHFFISFNPESGVFGKVPLPRSLVNTTRFIHAAKVNGSLGLLEYRDGVYDVWAKRWGANDTSFWRICNYFGVYETFTKIGTIDVGGQLYGGYGAPVPEVELDVGIGGYLWWLLI